jgi:hypothetical protein
MAKQTVNTGTTANDRSGDSLRTAFTKINANFTEVYTALGLSADTTLNLGNFVFEENTVRLTNSTNDDSTATTIVIAQPITTESDLTVGGDIIPSGNVAADIGSPTNRFRDLYLSSNTIYLGATTLGVDNVGNLLIGGQAVADVGTAAWANVTGKPTFATVATSGSYTDLSNTPTAVSEFTNDVGYITAAEAAAGITVNPTGDLKGSVFADDSTLLVDATNGIIPWSVISGAATVATSGSYNDLSNKPTIPTLGNFSFSANNITASSGAAPILLKIFGGDSADPPALINREWSFNTNGSITFPDSTTQTTAYTGPENPFNQDLDSTDSPNFVNMGLAGTAGAGYATLSITTDRDFYIGVNNTSSGASSFAFGSDGSFGVPGPATFNGNLYGGTGDRIYLAGEVGEGSPSISIPNVETGETDTLWIQNQMGAGVEITTGAGSWLFDDNRFLHFASSTNDDYNIGESIDGFNIRSDLSFGIATNFTTDAKYWIFDTDGSLTLPGDIKSETAINIDINLSDSTLRRWTFGEDGNTEFPGNITTQGFIGTAEENLRVESGKISLNSNQTALSLYTDAGGSYTSASWSGNNIDFTGVEDIYLETLLERFDSHFAGSGSPWAAGYSNITVRINDTQTLTVTGASFSGDTNWRVEVAETPASDPTAITTAEFFYDFVSTLELDRNDNSYAIALDDSNFRVNTRRDIRLESGDDIYIDGRSSMRLRNLSRTSGITIETDWNNEAYEWQFGEDGNLTAPGDITVAGQITGTSTASTLVLAAEPNSNTAIQLNDTVDSAIRTVANLEIRTDVANTAKTWTFGTDGSLTLPSSGSIDAAAVMTVKAYYGPPGSYHSWTFDGQNGTFNKTSSGYLELKGPDGVKLTATDTSKILTFGEDGNLTIPGDIRSESAINIDINLSDSTLRRWTFGEDGVLNLPGSIQLSSGGIIAGTVGLDNGITIGASDTNSNTVMNGDVFLMDDAYFGKAIQEKFQELADATGAVNHDCSGGHIFYHASPDANWTVNLTNFTLITNYATTITIIIDQGGTGYYPNALQIGGAAQTINWQGNATPTPSTNRQDVVSFSILAVTGGSYIVFGQLTGF